MLQAKFDEAYRLYNQVVMLQGKDKYIYAKAYCLLKKKSFKTCLACVETMQKKKSNYFFLKAMINYK